jgi:hypothetical protein
MPIYVSAQYVTNQTPPPDQLIRAVDANGAVWWVSADSDESDWLQFITGGGTVKAAAVTPSATAKGRTRRDVTGINRA